MSSWPVSSCFKTKVKRDLGSSLVAEGLPILFEQLGSVVRAWREGEGAKSHTNNNTKDAL